MNEKNVVATQDQNQIIEQVVVQGDLSRLRPEQRAQYYVRVCESLGVNPLTRPFEYIVLNGRLTLYARRDCTDQLRRIHGINISIVSRERMDDLYIVTARATDRSGRQDESTGVVSLAGLRGDALANALMKAETKAKRRVTLSLVGLGWLDETELETVPGARTVTVTETGEIEAPAEHWIDNPSVRERFWSYIDSLSLTNRDVCEALGVDDIHEYRGSMREAKEAIEAWVASRSIEEVDPTPIESGKDYGPGWPNDPDAVTHFWSKIRASWPRVRPDQVLSALGVKVLTTYDKDMSTALEELTVALGEPEEE